MSQGGIGNTELDFLKAIFRNKSVNLHRMLILESIFKIRQAVAMVALILLGGVFQASASDCRALLLSEETLSPIESQASVADLPLPKNLVELIRKHPISRFADLVTSRGLSIDFEVGTPMMMIGDPSVIGESQQAVMIEKYLRLLFPKSQIVFYEGMLSPPNRNKKNVRFSIFDPAETDTNTLAHQIYSLDSGSTELPMPLLKAGLPSMMPSLLTKPEMRKRLGFGANTKRIASLYLKDLSVLEGEENPLHTLQDSGGFDQIILSFNPSSFDHDGSLLAFYPRLSRMHLDSRIQNAKVIVNDTLNRMPYIYAAVDMAVVVGPVNFFEPLNARVPTLLYMPTSLMRVYSKSVLDHMQQIAQTSGGAEIATTQLQFDRALGKMLAQPPRVIPPSLLVKNGKSPFERVLDRLLEMMKQQTGI